MSERRLCHLNEIPTFGSRGFRRDDFSIFAVRKADAVYLYRNSCPHIGVALEWVEHQFLDSSQTLIQCANHGALFNISDGKCVSGPCLGQALTAVPFVVNDEGYIVLV